jgi:membrane protein
VAGKFSEIKNAASARWTRLRAEQPWLDHVVRAWTTLSARNGSSYAAAITYFSFLALFPLILLAVAITGFVLHAHPAAQQSLFNHITTSVPGSFGTTLHSSITTAIRARAGVGIIGLVGVLIAGLGWIGNLRTAIDGVWGKPPAKRKFLAGKFQNLEILVGLGFGILVSLGLTVLGTALTGKILQALDLDHLTGAGTVVRVLGLLLAVLGDVLIFFWVLVRMPQVSVPARVGLRAAIIAAIGLEILKVVGTYTIAASAHSPTAGPFAGLLAVLIWIQLVSRFLLYCVAWTATADGAEDAAVLEPASATAMETPS